MRGATQNFNGQTRNQLVVAERRRVFLLFRLGIFFFSRRPDRDRHSIAIASPQSIT